MFRRCLACSSGGVAVSTALLMALLIGLTGLATEASRWYETKRSMQGAADAAAMSAALALDGAGSCSNTAGTSTCSSSWPAGLQGLSVVSENSWEPKATNGIQVKVVSPPTVPDPPATRDWSTYNCQGSNGCAVEVSITQKQLPLFGSVFKNFSAPVIGAYAIATVHITHFGGHGCILALANATDAILVRGGATLKANCGLFVDGGIAQTDPNPRCPTGVTVCGDISFNGSNSAAQISSLTVTGSSSLTAEGSTAIGCPTSHCFQYNPQPNPPLLPGSAVKTSTATACGAQFCPSFPTVPLGVKTGGVVTTSQGSGYTNGTRTFTVVGGTGAAAKFTATVSGGKVTAIGAVTDPGAYTTFPTNPVTVTSDTGGGSGAQFTLTEGCFTWAGTAIAGRKYCSIGISGNGTTNFPAGGYYIAGGDSNCVGFCISGAKSVVTSDTAGVTFYLTNGEGTGTFGASSYATININGGTITLCAPGTSCKFNTCTGSCLLFFQDPTAPQSTSPSTPASTKNNFAGGSAENFYGLVYLRNQTFATAGNSTMNGCTGVVAKYLDIGGTPTFSNGCLPGDGIGTVTTIVSTLSE